MKFSNQEVFTMETKKRKKKKQKRKAGKILGPNHKALKSCVR